ncbi:nuclear transport factor 2 family protein [Siccirubricoccus phaeus]|uniref:nuclear transport factor 2 family protein n=1 Tax=Siccirubricoccus phaeus TaxID=2595053 RepID=UPI00165CD354|nr:nuclear transport factor 2 family protein [Siccirubricoccus phaeus]
MTTAMTISDEAASFAGYEAIAATLQWYIDGAQRGDSSLMRRAFLDGASIRGSYGGKPADWTLQAFCELIDRGGAAPDLQARIVAIEFAGSAAMARLEAANWRGTRYTDFFVLVMRDGVWRISSKVFFSHARA